MALGLENYIANSYLRALVVLVVSFILLKILVFVIEKIVLRFTSKTKTSVDDIFIEKSSKPLTFLVLLIGFRIAIEELSLAQNIFEVTERIILSVIVFLIGYLVFIFIDIIVLSVVNHKVRGGAVKDSLTSMMRSFLSVTWIILALLYVLEIWGVEIGPFLAGLGIAGLAIAFAMQSSLSNIFGGVSMILDRSVKVGDLVYLDDNTKGRIVKIGFRSTKILTFDNDFVILPNSKLADGKIQNVGEPEPKSRVVVPFGVAYGTDINRVRKIILAEIKKINHFIDSPEPRVRFLEMGDSSLNFKAYFYVDSFEHRFDAIDEANTRIYNTLNKNNIEIPFPQRDVHLKRK